MSNNLSIYNAVRVVPEEAQKAFNNGSFSGTDINPMWRIKTLTEQFGPCGFGWFVEVIEHWSEEINGEITTNVAINLYVKYDNEWSKPIYGIGGSRSLQQFKNGPKVSDEAYKMAYTDAISVAAKALGVGADIYFEKDTTKYTNTDASTPAKKTAAKVEQPKAEQPKPQDDLSRLFEDAKYEIRKAQKTSDLFPIRDRYMNRLGSYQQAFKDELNSAYKKLNIEEYGH